MVVHTRIITRFFGYYYGTKSGYMPPGINIRNSSVHRTTTKQQWLFNYVWNILYVVNLRQNTKILRGNQEESLHTKNIFIKNKIVGGRTNELLLFKTEKR